MPAPSTQRGPGRYAAKPLTMGPKPREVLRVSGPSTGAHCFTKIGWKVSWSAPFSRKTRFAGFTTTAAGESSHAVPVLPRPTLRASKALGSVFAAAPFAIAKTRSAANAVVRGARITYPTYGVLPWCFRNDGAFLPACPSVRGTQVIRAGHA